MAIEFEVMYKGQGFIALIDDEDKDLLRYGWVCQWKNRIGNAMPTVLICTCKEGKQTSVALYRVIMARVLGYEPSSKQYVDHRDLDRLNNTRSNLRIATCSQNRTNSSVRSDNLTGIKGVNKMGNKYRARIGFNGKVYHLGLFTTIEDANRAYLEAAQGQFGEFARGE